MKLLPGFSDLEMGDNEVHGFNVRIIQDDDPESPREWSNVGTMACWHNRYNLGDEQPSVTPNDYMICMLGDAMEYEHHSVDREKLQDVIEALEEGEAEEGTLQEYVEKYYVILPLYLYDHSGITMSTAPFSCPWDSGQVGYIYASRVKLAEEGIKDGEATLRQEVETYDQYLRGDVYGYDIEGEDGESLDSCWGFFGFDYVRQQALEALEYWVEEYRRAHLEQVKVFIKHKVPLDKRMDLLRPL